ncbi:MAG: hypothetical protein ACYCPQ_03575 [Elusimicrobiota bacterium]
MKRFFGGWVLVPVLFLASAACSCWAAGNYGSKGLYPVYETAGQWLIYDKNPSPAQELWLSPGQRYLLVGSKGSGIFTVGRDSQTYGGVCQGSRPIPVKAALLRGPRSLVGSPIIGIRVPRTFSLRGSRAAFQSLRNNVDEETYHSLEPALQARAIEDITRGRVAVDFSTAIFADAGSGSRPEKKPAIQTTIDFGAAVNVKGLIKPFVIVNQAAVSNRIWRCLRLTDGSKIIGDCARMPRRLMAETGLLRFVSYDPSGAGRPYLFAFTKEAPLWGDERWGFALGAQGPKLFLMDAMDTNCREGF